MFEIYFMVQGDSGLITNDHALRQWSFAYLSSLSQTDRQEGKKEPRIANRLENMLNEAGFSTVRCEMRKIHLSPWDVASKVPCAPVFEIVLSTNEATQTRETARSVIL